MKLDVLSRSLGRSILKTKANSPHIFFALGVAGVIGGAVLASKATLKLEDTLDEIKDECEELQEIAKGAREHLTSYTEQDYYRDMGFVFAKSAAKIGRLYAPAIVVGGFGIASLTGSHIQLTRRNAALTATLAALTKAYNEYRSRVQEELGIERESALYHNVKDEEVEVDGKMKKIQVVDPNGRSPYARCFDTFSTAWEKDAEVNKIFLECQQKYANDKLRYRGHVMLNDVYDLLGLDRTSAGAVVGWIYDGNGDNFIDFDIHNPLNESFLSGYENSIWLDFNVDGVVYEMIGKRSRR